MLEFHGFCGFFSVFSALGSRTEMMVLNFLPFSYWKSTKFVGNLKIHVLSTMQVDNFVVHHRHTGYVYTSALLGFNGMLSEKPHF